MNKYFIICNAISKIYKCDSWAYLVGWSSVEVDEWTQTYPGGGGFTKLEEITRGVLNGSVEKPYYFDTLKDAKDAVIRIKANDFQNDTYVKEYNYHIVNFVPAHLNEVIEI